LKLPVFLQLLSPTGFSVTYGAGGSTRDEITEIVDELQKRFGVPVMHHFTCVGHSKNELKAVFIRSYDDLFSIGVAGFPEGTLTVQTRKPIQNI